MNARHPIRGWVCGTAAALAALASPALATTAGETDSTRSAASKSDVRHRSRATHASANDRANEPKDGKQTGNASFYSHRLSGHVTASGDRYDPSALTAAHRTLPIGTKVRVVNPKNDKSVVVTVNDRGPVPKSRVMDVSSAAADALDMKKSGVTKVNTEVVGKAERPGAKEGPSPEAGTSSR